MSGDVLLVVLVVAVLSALALFGVRAARRSSRQATADRSRTFSSPAEFASAFAKQRDPSGWTSPPRGPETPDDAVFVLDEELLAVEPDGVLISRRWYEMNDRYTYILSEVIPGTLYVDAIAENAGRSVEEARRLLEEHRAGRLRHVVVSGEQAATWDPWAPLADVVQAREQAGEVFIDPEEAWDAVPMDELEDDNGAEVVPFVNA